MSNGESSPWHLVNLLFIPATAVIGWMAKQLSGKADKDEVNRTLDTLRELLESMRAERFQMHKENTERLDEIHRQMLDIVGGRYTRRSHD